MSIEDNDLFMGYITEARDEFVLTIQQQEWNTEMRTAAEDILIAYDQMKQRLLTQQKTINTTL